MTAPIQEPNTYRHLGGLQWGQNQLFRRPSPVTGGDTHVWAQISTKNFGFEGDGSDQWFDFYQVYISDAGLGTYFDYECDPGGGQFGDDRAFLLMLQSGIYTYTVQLQTADMGGVVPYDFVYQFRLCTLGGPEGTGPCNGTTDRFPGQLAATPLLQDREQWRISDIGGDDFWINRSWTVPILHPSPGDAYRTGELRLQYTDSTGSEFWWASIWIVRHGDVDWSESNFDDINATWNSGDPCVT